MSPVGAHLPAPTPPARRLALLVYELGLMAFFALSLPYFIWKNRKTGKYTATLRERLGRTPAGLNADGQPSLWVHAVSVGEVLAARTLLKALRERFPDRKLYLSTTTLTGHSVAQGLRGIDGLFFAPFDFKHPVRRVLDVVRPELLVLVETELWPNLIHEARRRGARIAVVNGRLSPRSFARYRRVRALLRHVLHEVDLFLMQAAPHAERIVALGAPKERVSVSGNQKFDALEAPHLKEQLAALLPPNSEPLLVAGSTVPGEEPLVLAAFAALRAQWPGARLILAPRHPERCPAVVPLVEAAGLPVVLRSTLAPGRWRDEVVVLDTLGELAQLYELADVVFVGGSLMPAGGHNILEPAVAGKAVVVGPHMENFQEIADAFLAEDALVQVREADELGPALVALLRDVDRRQALGARAQALVARNRGAVARTVTALAGLLE